MDGQFRLELPGGVKALRRLAGGQVVQRRRQGEQVAAHLRLADDLLGRGVAFGVDAGLAGQARLLGAAHVAGGAEVDHLDRPLVLQQNDVVGLEVAVDQGRRLRVHVHQHVADVPGPADHLVQRERLVGGGFQDVEQVAALDELHDQVGGLPLLRRVPVWALGTAYGLLLLAVAWLVILPGTGALVREVPLLHLTLAHLLYGVALLYGATGSTAFVAMRAGFDASSPLALIGLALAWWASRSRSPRCPSISGPRTSTRARPRPSRRSCRWR